MQTSTLDCFLQDTQRQVPLIESYNIAQSNIPIVMCVSLCMNTCIYLHNEFIEETFFLFKHTNFHVYLGFSTLK